MAWFLVKHRDFTFLPSTPEVKQFWHEADHTLPSSTEVKNAWRYFPLPNTSSWRGA